MAYDKVVDSAFLEAGLTLVGDSIRAKGGTSAKLEFPNGMKAAVDAIDTSKPEQTKTVTPKASAQTVTPDSGYTLSSVTVEGDADLVAGNIKSGVSIFGVAGSYEGGGGGGSGGLETCKLIMTHTFATAVVYQSALGEGIYWAPQEPGDFIAGVDVLCGSIIAGISAAATAENAVFIANDAWLVTAPAGGTVRFS